MVTALLFLVAYLLGIWSCVILGALILLHHRRPEAPVLRRRRYRDLPVPEVKFEAQKASNSSDEGISYQWINLTGIEEE